MDMLFIQASYNFFFLYKASLRKEKSHYAASHQHVFEHLAVPLAMTEETTVAADFVSPNRRSQLTG